MIKIFLRILASTLIAAFILVPAVASAQDVINCPAAGQPGADAHVCSSANNTAIDGSGGVIVKVTRFIAVLTGAASVIMIIIGGFKYVISQGEAAEINSAKNTILYALVGLVISVVAPFIIGFVISKL